MNRDGRRRAGVCYSVKSRSLCVSLFASSHPWLWPDSTLLGNAGKVTRTAAGLGCGSCVKLEGHGEEPEARAGHGARDTRERSIEGCSSRKKKASGSLAAFSSSDQVAS